MNIPNIKAAIKGMELVLRKENETGVNLLDMRTWQSYMGDSINVTPYDVAQTRNQLLGGKGCGTAACFAGHVALMPHFQKLGISPSHGGMPIYAHQRHYPDALTGARNISELLEISDEDARELCALSGAAYFYGNKDLKDITTSDVIAALYKLLAKTENEVMA